MRRRHRTTLIRLIEVAWQQRCLRKAEIRPLLALRMALLDLPEAMVQEILAHLGVKVVRQFRLVSRSAREQVTVRIKRLPDKSWRLGHGDPRSQDTTYFSREEQVGEEWLKRYEDSIVLWDASGGARLYPQTKAAWKPHCQVCLKSGPHGLKTMDCCSALVCRNCGGSSCCLWCGSPTKFFLDLKPDEVQHRLELLRQRAAKGTPNAQFQLGQAHYYGFHRSGVEKCYETALHWFERAARQGNVDAQYFAASCVGGLADELKDHRRKSEFLAMCAAQRPRGFSGEAMSSLGSMYLFRQIPAPDDQTSYREAVRLFKLDIDLWGHAEAYLNLGKCYEWGTGVPVDDSEALRLWTYVASEFDGEEEADDAREQLERRGCQCLNLSGPMCEKSRSL